MVDTNDSYDNIDDTALTAEQRKHATAAQVLTMQLSGWPRFLESPRIKYPLLQDLESPC